MEKRISYFDGGLTSYIGWTLLGMFVTVITFGICLPWAYCMLYRWEAEHTIIDGKRLKFDGNAFQLFGTWIKWLFLIVITFGIYSLWVGIKLKQWRVKHTYFAN